MTTAKNAGASRGQQALEEACAALVERRPIAEWAHREIVRCYREFRDGAKSAGWTAAELRTPAPRTLDEAFAIAPAKGRHALPRRQRALLESRLRDRFFGPAPLPRNVAGFETAASEIGSGITSNQIREIVESIAGRGKA